MDDDAFAGSSVDGATPTTKKESVDAYVVSSTKTHAPPAAAGHGANPLCGATSASTRDEELQLIATFSVDDGAAGSVKVTGERSHGHDATAVVEVGGGGESGAPLVSTGAPSVSAGVEQPAARERHEKGGVVEVGDGEVDEVGERVEVVVGVNVEDGLIVCDDVGDTVGDTVCVDEELCVPVPITEMDALGDADSVSVSNDEVV